MSLYSFGQTLFGFQWDILLLEVGVLAAVAAPTYYQWIVLAPSTGTKATPPVSASFYLANDDPAIGMFMVRWLLFRFVVYANLCWPIS
jgi:hypothetical protein